MSQKSENDANATQHVVIVGGGFAGLHAARRLGKAGYRVTLLDKRNFQLFQPLLYQVATGALTVGDIAYPQRSLLRRLKNVRTLNATAYDVDPKARIVFHEHGELHYDVLVVATGVKHNYFGHDEWRAFAPGLKTAEHAIEIRRRIFRAFELAEVSEDPVKRAELLTFAVVGGGPTGVELAGAIGELAHKTLINDFRNVDSRDAQVLLIEAGSEILPAYPAKLRAKARGHLKALGVTVHEGAMVEHIDGECLRVKRGEARETLRCGTVLWAAGVRPSLFGEVLAERTQAPRDRGGRILVSPDCSLPDWPEIFVAGDLAALTDIRGVAVPGLAPAAIQQGNYVAEVLRDRNRGKVVKGFRYVDWGSMAVIGFNRAVGNIRGWKTSGILAWFLWAFVHIRALVDNEQRARVFINWSWKYFTRKIGDRLITGDPTHTGSLREQRLARNEEASKDRAA
jgi:NADH dehydrogenase